MLTPRADAYSGDVILRSHSKSHALSTGPSRPPLGPVGSRDELARRYEARIAYATVEV